LQRHRRAIGVEYRRAGARERIEGRFSFLREHSDEVFNLAQGRHEALHRMAESGEILQRIDEVQDGAR
jgi:hypothetical protein